ncbi:MAG: ATP-binding cassette domain-containing protein [Kiritimatiellae bacterium]|nr:ATP-binding cassette domain-containing protein [Kiritimatiellia bacterium]
MIRFDGVVKKFNSKAVLAGVSFEIRQGEIFAIVGPSGTGKSVTLKHMVRLLTPTSGSVWLGSEEVSAASGRRLAKIRERFGYLFQGGAFLGSLTVGENIQLPLRERRNLSEFEIERRTHEALEAVDLAGAEDKMPAELSGGMLKRAGLARALVRNADIMLYDEPTSALDPVTARQVNRLITRTNTERKITSVVVTHDLAAALGYAHRILMLKGGKVLECCSPDKFVKSPVAEVKEFLEASGL